MDTLPTITNVQNYISKTRGLYAKGVVGAKSAKFMTPIPGVKHSAPIQRLVSSVVFSSRSDCSFGMAGDTADISDRILTIGRIKVNKEYCTEALEAKKLANDAQNQMRLATKEPIIPFEEELVNADLDAIANAIEVAIWQGDTQSTNPNLNKFNGLLKILDGEPSVINGNVGNYTDVDPSNILRILDDIVTLIPPSLMSNNRMPIIFLGFDLYVMAILALKNANMYHYTDELKAGGSFVIPGTPIRAEAVGGLNGTKNIVAATSDNLFYGFDGENDEEYFRYWVSDTGTSVRFLYQFNAGVQVAFPDEVVRFKPV